MNFPFAGIIFYGVCERKLLKMYHYQISTYLPSPDALPVWAEHISGRIKRESNHTHDCFEIMYIRSGAACCQVNNRLYPVTRGDMYIFAPGDVHAFSISGELNFDNLLFSMELFSDAEIAELKKFRLFNSWSSPGDSPEKKLSVTPSDIGELDNAFDELIFECQKNHSGSDILLKALLIRLLCMACRKGDVSGDRVDPDNALQLSALFDFIAKHYAEDLSLAQLARAARVSPNYLNEFMRRNIGQGAMEYLLRYRIDEVRNLLEHSSATIAEIAVSTGFYDTSHLIRTFRRYIGMPPGSYRKQFRNQNR